MEYPLWRLLEDTLTNLSASREAVGVTRLKTRSVYKSFVACLGPLIVSFLALFCRKEAMSCFKECSSIAKRELTIL